MNDRTEYLPLVIKNENKIRTSVGDIDIEVNSVHEARLAEFDEHDILEEWMENISSEDIVWDIGAGIGVYTTAAGYISNSVYAFEPNPKNYRKTKETIDNNGVDANINNFALGKENTKADLSTEKIDTGTRTQFSDQGEVEVYRGDGLENIPKPDVVKIDVEGSEVEVINGLKGILPNINFLLLEVHGGRHDIRKRGHDRDELHSRINSAGFQIDVLQNVKGGNEHWACKRM
ncbi:FkbM family methyltransferase [Halosimplex aquaticum]|nr:FkbM family methyltransferase [Halosimplex aquaticum]